MASNISNINIIPLDDGIIGILEFFILSLAFISSTIFGILMWETKTIHRNLRFIFLNMVLASFGECITRIWLTVFQIFFPGYSSLLVSIMYICPGMFASYFTFIEISMAVERLMATFFVKNYENSRHPILVLNIIIPWLLNFGILYMAIFNILIGYKKISYSLVICNVFTWMSFIILYRSNQRLYLKCQASLSEKYQLRENIRITKLLAIFVVFTALKNSVSTFYILIQVYYFAPNKMALQIHILDYAYRIFLALFFVTYPFVLISFHRDLRRQFKKRILRITPDIKLFNKVSPENVIGQQAYTKFEEVDYFKGLEQQWTAEFEKLAKNKNLFKVETLS